MTKYLPVAFGARVTLIPFPSRTSQTHTIPYEEPVLYSPLYWTIRRWVRSL